VLDRHRRLRGEQPQHAGRSVGQRLQRDLPDHDQHAGDLAVAQHRLKDGRASARGLHQRRGERRVGARVGDEVGVLGRERAAVGGRGLGPRLDRHRGDLDPGHGGRHEVTARRLEQERHRRAGNIAGRLADRGPRVVGARQCARHAGDRAHAARLVAQHVVEALQVALVALALQLGGEHAREHREQLLVGVRERLDRVAQRRQRADARAVRQLERDAEVGAGADALLHRQRAVDRMAGDLVAEPRRAILGHVRAERVAERGREVRAQADAAAVARVDDAVDELPAVEVREVQHRVWHVALEQVEDGTRRVRERPVGRRSRRSGGLDGTRVHVGHCRRWVRACNSQSV
jgi:hypothetical protein